MVVFILGTCTCVPRLSMVAALILNSKYMILGTVGKPRSPWPLKQRACSIILLFAETGDTPGLCQTNDTIWVEK